MDNVLKEDLKPNFFFLLCDSVEELAVLDVMTDTQYLTLKLSKFVLRRGFLTHSWSYIFVQRPILQENHRFLFYAFSDSNKVGNICWVYDVFSPTLSYQVVDWYEFVMGYDHFRALSMPYNPVPIENVN